MRTIEDFTDGLTAAYRLGAFDPWLSGARLAGALHWGPSVGSAVAAAGLRFPARPAVVDEGGSISYRQLDCEATNLAAHLRSAVGDGTAGILCRNHRGFVIAQLAAERAGVDLVLLSTALPGPKLNEVLFRERVRVLIADEEFLPLLDTAGQGSEAGLEVLVADRIGPGSVAEHSRTAIPRFVAPTTRQGNLVLLTSGTTGPPKGARRANRSPRPNDANLLTRIPYRVGDLFLVAPPLFHAWGLSQMSMALATNSTVILRRKFDTAEAIRLLTERRIDVLAVVPLMLRRILDELPPDHGVHRPRIVASSGNVLSGPLALEWMDRFGDQLYNIYGSTEAAIGTIADPTELRRAPGTVGRPPDGVTLSIRDDEGMPMPTGRRGRVFLSSALQFSGYTDGSDRERAGTLIATGDLGHVDADGLLHVDGRANDMIVTGGENVFPSRVEEVLDTHPEVEMSAVVGMPDPEYGQRVVAFVVPRRKGVARKRMKPSEKALREAAAAELQSFMVPKEFVFVNALPMTTTGKVIRHRLAVLGDADRI